MCTLHGCCADATTDSQKVVPISEGNLTARERHYLTQYREDENGCWIWQGTQWPTGYGRPGRYGYAHRFFYERLVGPVVPTTLHLDHLCRVKLCVNPAHLEAVPAAVNLLRGESPFAKNARKTHCIRGHEFTAENTRVNVNRNGRPGRTCRTCQLASMRDRYYRIRGRKVPRG